MPDRLRLNIFSPLPPLPTDIANHTAGLLPALTEQAEVVLWTDQAEWDPAVERLAKVQRFAADDLDARSLNQADLNIYNIGNNARFHRAIFDVARQAPGLMILHDTRLQHFFANYTETGSADQAFYVQAMQRAHGLDGRAAAKSLLAGKTPFEEMVANYPMTAAASQTATGVLVHNEAVWAALRSQLAVPLYFQPLSFAYRPAERASRADTGPIQLILFGFIGENRRLHSVLRALAGLPGKEDFRLDIYGRMEAPEAAAAWIAELGLQALVRVHDFVPEDELNAALAQADLALNLRYPSMGEASGSQLRIWQAGLAAVVTRTGWYETLPPDTVFFVDQAREIEHLRGHLLALRKDRRPFRLAGQRGREVLERLHSPTAYAAGLTALARTVGVGHARRQALDLARTAVDRMSGFTRGVALPGLQQDVAREIAIITNGPARDRRD